MWIDSSIHTSFSTMPLKYVVLILLGLMTTLVIQCNDSSPTGNDPNPPPTAPDTVDYSQIMGEWEGALPYQNPREDNYESDSLYFTHFEITRKRAAVGDSVGITRWDNRDEYCTGTLTAHTPSGDTTMITISNINAQSSSVCGHRTDLDMPLQHFSNENQEYIKVLTDSIVAPGKLYPK